VFFFNFFLLFIIENAYFSVLQLINNFNDMNKNFNPTSTYAIYCNFNALQYDNECVFFNYVKSNELHSDICLIFNISNVKNYVWITPFALKGGGISPITDSFLPPNTVLIRSLLPKYRKSPPPNHRLPQIRLDEGEA
jgi:hypothetical protein